MKNKVIFWIYLITIIGLLAYSQYSIYSRAQFYNHFDYFGNLYWSFYIIVIATIISLIFQLIQNIKSRMKPWHYLWIIPIYGFIALIVYVTADQVASLISYLLIGSHRQYY